MLLSDIFMLMQCSRTCRSGVRTREVMCFAANEAMDEMNQTMFVFDIEVDIEVCRNFSREEEPVASEVCNSLILCPVRFQPGQYEDVSFAHTHTILQGHRKYIMTL